MKSENIGYIPGLDHLRGFMALLIVFYHGLHLFEYELTFHKSFTFDYFPVTKNPLFSVLMEGHTAVAFFIVLSGFVLTLGSFGKNIHYTRFLRNRFLRIHPLFLLMIFAGICAFPGAFRLSPFLLSISGLAGPYSGLQLKSFSAMLWVVYVEWQFYLVFPFVLLILRKKGPSYLFGLIIVFTFLRFISFMEGANIRDLSYMTIMGRMDQFALGMLAALFYRSRHFARIPRSAGIAFFPGICLVVIFSLYGFHKMGGWAAVTLFKVFWPTLEGGMWALFLLSYIPMSEKIPEKISVWLSAPGRISYSIFLIHFIVIHALVQKNWIIPFDISHRADALLNTLFPALPIILVLSALTYAVIEKPFLEMRSSYARH